MQVFEISSTSVVDEVVTRFPATARVFIRRRMHCVGCDVSRFETVGGAAKLYHQPLEPLLADLRSAAAHLNEENPYGRHARSSTR
jgi:hybrid cluster-associated redox disulfide protein